MDLSPDGDALFDVQRETGDTRDALDGQDGRDGFEDVPAEDHEACDPAILVLQPVSFVAAEMWPDGPRDCSEARVSEVRVFLFQGTDLVLDSTLPCLGDTVVVDPIAPGSYELAAVAKEFFVKGIERLRAFYPQAPDCVPDYIACQPLALTVMPCGSMVVPLMLCCDDAFAGCNDCCGGA